MYSAEVKREVERLEKLNAALKRMYLCYERFDEARKHADKTAYQKGSAILIANERFRHLLEARDEVAKLLEREEQGNE